MGDAQLDGKSIKELRAIIQAAGLSFGDCIEKADLLKRAAEALRRQGAGTPAAAARFEPPERDGGGVWRRFRVAPGLEVPLLTEPRDDAPASALAGPGTLILTTGRAEGRFVEMFTLLGRAAWLPLEVASGRPLLLPVAEAGRHGDRQELPGSLQATRQQFLLDVLRLELFRGPLPAGRLPWPEGGEALVERNGQKAHLFGPDGRSHGVKPGEALPLVVLMHGASKKGPRVPQGWDFGGMVEAYRASRAAAKRNILILVPEARDHTWDLITISARQDMDFLQWAIDEVRKKYAVDDSRIAVAGCSDGGSMTLSLALRNPDVFQAGLAQAAGFCVMEPALVPQAARRPRLFMEYGTEDELGFYRNAPHHRAKWAGAGYDVRFRAIVGGGHGASREFVHDACRLWLSPPLGSLRRTEEPGQPDAIERDWPAGRLNPYGMEAVANFRDLAGIDPSLPVRVHGGWLRRGLLFRTGLWSMATEADIAKLREKLKIATFLDLRQSLGEQALDGPVWDAYPPSPSGRHSGDPARGAGEPRRVHCDVMSGLDEEASASPDLARSRPAAASSESRAERAAAFAVDGKPDTRWTSAYEDQQWLCVDLGAPRPLKRVDVRWEKACAETYRVQGRLSESGPWEDLAPAQLGAEGWVRTELWQGSVARYVKVACERRATEYGFSIWDLRVRPAEEADLALGKPARASSEKSGERLAACAVDGSRETRWSSRYEDNQWLSVDLGAVFPLSRVEVLWEKACAKSYELQGSLDGSTWDTMVAEEGREGWVATPLPPGSSARYVRMQGLTRATEYSFSIWQFKVYGEEAEAVETRDLALGRPTKASSSRRPAASAVDGSPDTRWTSEYADEQWLSVDLGFVRRLSRVEVKWEKACARRYLVQGSRDGDSWQTIAEEEGREGWVVTALPSGSEARHIRMLGLTRSTAFGFSIYKFQVYGGEGAPDRRAEARSWRRAALRRIGSVADYFCVLNKSILLLNGEAVAAALRELLEPKNYPLAFGCMQGKDRTGLLSILLLAALGASEQEILDDYLLSNEARERNAEISAASRERYEKLKQGHVEELSEPPPGEGVATAAVSAVDAAAVGAVDAAAVGAADPAAGAEADAAPPAEAPAAEPPDGASAEPATEAPDEAVGSPAAGLAAAQGTAAAAAAAMGSTGLEEALTATDEVQEEVVATDSKQEEPPASELDLVQHMLCYKEVADFTLAVLRREGGILRYLDSIGFRAEEVERLRQLLVEPAGP